MMRTLAATLIILASFIGISKGEKSNRVNHSEVKAMKNTPHKSSFAKEDWGSAMTAGWALHIIKHTPLY